MAKKRNSAPAREPYSLNDDIHVQYEVDFQGDTIRPGDMLKFKNTRGTFRFRLLAHNIAHDVTWIDCMDNKTGEFRAFYIDKLKSVVRPKKSRAKKLKNG